MQEGNYGSRHYTEINGCHDLFFTVLAAGDSSWNIDQNVLNTIPHQPIVDICMQISNLNSKKIICSPNGLICQDYVRFESKSLAVAMKARQWKQNTSPRWWSPCFRLAVCQHWLTFLVCLCLSLTNFWQISIIPCYWSLSPLAASHVGSFFFF